MHLGHPSLNQQLEAFRTGLLGRLPPWERQAILDAAEDLRACALDRKPLSVGQPAPAFTLADQHGRDVTLAERLAHGPVVLLFVRGGWCPFCTLTLRAYQDALPAIHAAGGELLAITPQPADTCAATAERDLLAFPMLSDIGNDVANRYGVAYGLAPVLQDLYRRLGHDLPRLNRTGDWQMPLPATFIIGRDGMALHAHVEPVAHRRLEPSSVVALLQQR